MEITKIRIKKEFAPLTVYSSIVVASNGFSTLLQTYKLRSNEYIPNRNLTPTTIKPNVIAYANDGSLKTPYANANLVEMHWYVDGFEISTVWTEGVDYEILTVGSDRGSLVVYKNIPTTEQHRLHFEGVISDTRLGQRLDVRTDEVTLRTIVLAEYQYKLGLGCDSVLHYNPFTDPLLMYEHKVSHGISPDMTESEAKSDKLSYLCNVPVILFKGDAQATEKDDFTIELYRIDDNNKETLITPSDDNEVLELDKFHILFDVRLITLENYAIVAKVDGEEKDRIQFAVRRLQPKFTQPRHANETDIVPTAKARYDYIQIECNGKIVEHPGLNLKIDWFTTTAHKANVQHNEGEETLFQLYSTGIGDTYEDDWLEIEARCEYKPAYSIATDGDDILTDEKGDVLIFN